VSTLPRRCLDCRRLTATSPCQACRARREAIRQRGTTAERGYGATWAALSAAVLERDGHTCRYCGRPATTADHVIPKAKGGTDEMSNLVAACRSCNSGKGARILTRRVP